MTPVYGDAAAARRPPPLQLSDAAVVAGAVVVGVAARSASAGLAVAVGTATGLVVWAVDPWARRWMLVVIVLVGALAGWRADEEHHRLAPERLGPHAGWVLVVGDPRTFDGPTARVVMGVEGQRFEAWLRGPDAERARAWRAGDLVHLVGERRPFEVADRRTAGHGTGRVVGVLTIDRVNRMLPAPRRAERSANQVRDAIERGSRVLPDAHAALFRGLVVGDRSGRSAEDAARFHDSGLSHLTVVSGLNVALVLATVAPFTGRLRPVVRWAVTLAVVAWFAMLTRFEPSVLRASVMAVLSATAFVSGHDRAPFRLLCLAVIVLLLADPLLAHAIGFWLSVGATAGVCTIGPRLADLVPGPRALASLVGITLGAQVGVAPVLLGAFGRVPLVSVAANVLAVPVASAVKLYGLPASLVAGVVPPLAGPLMWPCGWGVRWVDAVAAWAAASEPSGAAHAAGWAAVGALVGIGVACGRRAPRRS